MFYSCAPMVAVFYALFNSFPKFTGKIVYDDVCQLLLYLRRNAAICADLKMMFDLHAMAEGNLSFSVFFGFASQTSELYLPLYKFRLSLINNIITKPILLQFMNRKAKIQDIKSYMANTDLLPPENCFSKFVRKRKGYPHPCLFHYDVANNENVVGFSLLTTLYIKRFKSNFVYKSEAFIMKNLGRFHDISLIKDIDDFYITYRLNSPDRLESIRRRSSMNTSELLVNQQQLSLKAASSTKSILKIPSFRNVNTLPMSKKTSVRSTSRKIFDIPNEQSCSHKLGNNDGGNSSSLQFSRKNSSNKDSLKLLNPVDSHLEPDI